MYSSCNLELLLSAEHNPFLFLLRKWGDLSYMYWILLTSYQGGFSYTVQYWAVVRDIGFKKFEK